MLIFVLLTVHWALAPGVVEGGCRGLRHVENGRTFFRYGGLFVTFSCNPGFRIHGHRTSSCVSGQWVREPPLCVAPGCTSPARLIHGSTVLSPDGSLVRFACDGGFRLFGSPLLYCRGDRWNGSAPVCKESDIMSSFHLKRMSSYEPTLDLIPDILPNQRSLFNTVSNTDAKLTLLKPSLLGVSQPKASLHGDLAKSPQKIPEKRPAKKAWFDKATIQGREESSGLRGTVNKLDTLKEPARNVNPLAVPWLTPVSSPTALMRISPVSSPPKPTESIPLVTAVTNEQETQTSSSLLDWILSPPPGDGERPPPLMLTAQRAQTESVLPVLRTSATTVQNVVLTTAYPHSDGFTTSTPRKDSQEVLKETALSDIKNPLKPPKMPHSPTVSSPELPLSRQDSFFSVASPKPFTATSPPFITTVLQEEAPPQRSPTAGPENLLPRTEVLTVATRPGPALRLTEPPDVTTADPYLPYPVTEPEREQMAAGEDSAVLLHVHRFPVSNTDGELNDISGSDRIWPESVPAHIQRNRTLVTSTQSQENVERSGTSGKQEPESSTWPGLPFTASETPGFPVRTRRPVCPYPPLPAHGTFYFHTIINPGPFQYKHYIQYACYPGYTLANGDVYSYCLHDGRWSGSTPECIEVTPCSLNNGGCSQVCRASPENHAECLCQPGFLLLQDQRTCRDLDECVEGLHQCQQVCENTLGSYRCSCSDGFQLSTDRISCSDVDECAVAVGRTGCMFGCVNTPGSFLCRCPPGHSLNPDGSCEDNDECLENGGQGSCEGACVNTPGSFHCACPYGYQLAGDGRTCISKCPPGHRKQRSDAPAGNSTTGLCVDINECQEMERDHPDKCEWKCVNLPGSHLCICPRGYTQHPGGHRCRDFNECALRNGGCSHTCVNQRGGYRCACPKNYRLSPYNRRTCQPSHSSQRTVS